MVKLTPVDGDPFSPAPMQGQPKGLTPVDYNPFEAQSLGDPRSVMTGPGGFDAAFAQFQGQPAPAAADQQRMEQLASAYRRAPEGQGMAVDQQAERMRKNGNPYQEALMQGLTFGLSDEINAAARSLAGRNGYDVNLAAAREAQDRSRAESPVGTGAAEFLGSMLSAPLIPAMRLTQGAGIAGRAVNAAATGAVGGAAYGFGTGEGMGDRASRAAGGALVGGALGGAAVPVVEGVVAGARAAANRLAGPFRGAINTDQEAARRIAGAFMADNIDPAQAQQVLQSSRATGAPVAVGDTGGETVRALARSSANTSPPARDALISLTQPRFEAQGDRTVDAIRRATGAAGDVSGYREGLQDAARRANKPAYDRAYAQGRQVWNNELADLTSAPAVQRAIADATERSRNVAASEGARPIRNPFQVDQQSGAVVLKPGITPDLQFWDVVKRNLDSQIDTLRRGGDASRARELIGLKNRLLENLDATVPTYAAARRGAAQFFGAEDALDAGSKFVTATMDNAVASRALGKMSAPERDLFREGFASTLINRVRELRDNRDVVKSIFGSQAARERINIALGSKQAGELEAFIKGEEMMDRLRVAVQGNSTSMRQWAELGLAGGAGLVASGGNPFDTKALATGALIYGLRRGATKINSRVAARVGQMLASDDPAVFQKAVQIVARDRRFLKAVEAATEFLGRGTRPLAVTVQPQGMIPAPADENGARRP
jgi:hypothetical protein